MAQRRGRKLTNKQRRFLFSQVFSREQKSHLKNLGIPLGVAALGLIAGRRLGFRIPLKLAQKRRIINKIDVRISNLEKKIPFIKNLRPSTEKEASNQAFRLLNLDRKINRMKRRKHIISTTILTPEEKIFGAVGKVVKSITRRL